MNVDVERNLIEYGVGLWTELKWLMAKFCSVNEYRFLCQDKEFDVV